MWLYNFVERRPPSEDHRPGGKAHVPGPPGSTCVEKAHLTCGFLFTGTNGQCRIHRRHSGESVELNHNHRAVGGDEATAPATLCSCEAQSQPSGAGGASPIAAAASHRQNGGSQGRATVGAAGDQRRRCQHGAPQLPACSDRRHRGQRRLSCATWERRCPRLSPDWGTALRPGGPDQHPEPAKRHSPRAASGLLSRMMTWGPRGSPGATVPGVPDMQAYREPLTWKGPCL